MLTYYRHQNGHTERVPEFRPERLAEPGSLHWIDLEDATEAEARVLTEAFHFHPLAVEDCLSDVNLPEGGRLHGLPLPRRPRDPLRRAHGPVRDARAGHLPGAELPRDPPQGADAIGGLRAGPVRQGPAGGGRQGGGLPRAPDPRPDVRELLPEPRRDRGQDAARPGGGVREPDPRHPRPDLHAEAGRDAAAAHLHARARDPAPAFPGRVPGGEPEGGHLLPRHLRQPLPDRGRDLLLPGHDAGHARRLPVGHQQPAERDDEAADRAHRGAGLADGDHRASTA